MLTFLSHALLLCVYLIGLFLVITLVQLRIVKYKNGQPTDWLYFLKPSKWLFHLKPYPDIQDCLNCIFVLSSVSFHRQCIPRAGLTIKLARSFKLIVNRLDDIVDNMPAKEVLALGEARLGTTLCPFLHALLDKESTHDFMQFVSKGAISTIEMCSFGNLLAQKLYKQAQLTLSYEQALSHSIKSQLRIDIAQENIEITGICFAFCEHLTKRDTRLLERVNQSDSVELTYPMLKEIYPQVAMAGELTQILHDIVEFRYDLQLEPSAGKISPNYLLAQLEKYSDHLKLDEAIKNLPLRTVKLNELSDQIKSTILSIKDETCNQSKNIGFMANLAYKFMWFIQQCFGFYIVKPRHEKQWAAKTPLKHLPTL